MRRSTAFLAELLPVLVLLALAALLVLPVPERRIPASPRAGAPASSPEAAAPAEESARKSSPAEIAALFGWRPRVQAPPRAPQAAPPAPPARADWLRPLGYVVGERGTATYLFKDTRTGAVLSLVPNVENRGWTLRAVREKDFLLESGGKTYTVPRSE